MVNPIIPPSPFFESWIFHSNLISEATALKCNELVLTTYPSGRFSFANWYHQIYKTQLLPENISMLFKRCLLVDMTLRRWKTSKHRWNNVVYLNVGIRNVEQHKTNVVYFNIDLKQRLTMLKQHCPFQCGVKNWF